VCVKKRGEKFVCEFVTGESTHTARRAQSLGTSTARERAREREGARERARERRRVCVVCVRMCVCAQSLDTATVRLCVCVRVCVRER